MTISSLTLATRLIGQSSVSSESSRPIADDVSNLLADAGFRITQYVYKTKEAVKGEKNKKVEVEKVNVFAVKGGDGQPALALSGHLDTMPYSEDGWNTDPLVLTERSGLLYGRGACDMKGFVALAMSVGMSIPAHELKRPFGLILTSDEEVGCVGVRRIVEQRRADKLEPIAKNIVIGEPTNLQPFILHKGYIYIRVLLRGKAGHSSEPHKGLNPVERAVPDVLWRINQLKESLGQIRDARYEVPFASLNVGVITTGEEAKKNTIPQVCTIELDVRTLQGQDPHEIVQALRKHIAPDGSIDGIAVEVQLVRAPTPPFETAPDAPLVTNLVDIFGKQPASTSFNTEGGILNSAGCTCVVCGLGSIEQAHKKNEYVAAEFFSQKVSDGYERLVRRFCCSEVEP
ncbi:MAG: acetylornithine deacetylase [Candidatus Paceibacterota bacterium]